MLEEQFAPKPLILWVQEAVNSIFARIDNTSLGQFVRERSQSFVAINSSIADIGYILYAFSAGEHLSALLLCGMTCKISGSIILLSNDKKGAAASKENRWPSKVVLFLHHMAKTIVAPIHRLIPRKLKAMLPNPFTAALSLYAFNGMTYFINGCQGLAHQAAFTNLSQTAAGITMTLGGFAFAASGFERHKGLREIAWSRRGQYLYAITPIFCILNLIASIAAGQNTRALALTLVTSMALFQIYVRHNFKRQRNA